MEEDKKRILMSFDIEPELRTEVKVLAARRNISMALWITRAIREKIQKEKQFDAEVKK
jgi:predicted transcriptional regulator